MSNIDELTNNRHRHWESKHSHLILISYVIPTDKRWTKLISDTCPAKGACVVLHWHHTFNRLLFWFFLIRHPWGILLRFYPKWIQNEGNGSKTKCQKSLAYIRRLNTKSPLPYTIWPHWDFSSEQMTENRSDILGQNGHRIYHEGQDVYQTDLSPITPRDIPFWLIYAKFLVKSVFLCLNRRLRQWE